MLKKYKGDKMQDLIEQWLWMLLVPFILVILASVWSIKSFQKLRETWRLLGRHLGVNADVPEQWSDYMGGIFPSLSGKIDGFTFFATMEARAYGRDTLTFTCLSVELSRWREKTLSIYTESLLDKLGKKLGEQDVELGTPIFDEQFIIQSNDEQFARQILSSDVRALVLQCLRLSGNLKIQDGKLIYEEIWTVKYEDDREAMLELVPLFIQIAKKIQPY